MNTRNRPAKATLKREPKFIAVGGPLHIKIADIDEDPDQPRKKDNPGFSARSIAELAASYGPKGPKSPISLRNSGPAPGRYIINHGHRRFRAAKVKGLDNIPAFIDDDYNEVDQVIENLQRDELTPREIADWIGRELARGKKKGEIAKSIGKSPAFVTQHVALLDLPPPIADPERFMQVTRPQTAFLLHTNSGIGIEAPRRGKPAFGDALPQARPTSPHFKRKTTSRVCAAVVPEVFPF